MDGIRAKSSLWVVFSSVVAASVMLFLFRGYQERRRMIKLRQQGFVS